MTSAAVGTTAEGRDDLVDRARNHGQLSVVDESAVDLPGELTQHDRQLPVPGRFRRRRGSEGDDDALDNFYRGSAGSSGPRLLPRTMPAGGRAPLGDGASGPRGDRAVAPAARSRCRTPRPAVRGGLWRGRDRRRIPSHGGPVLLRTAPALPLPTPGPVLGGSLAPHVPSVWRNVQQHVTTSCWAPGARGVSERSSVVSGCWRVGVTRRRCWLRTRVAKATGLGRKRVAKAAEVARLHEAAAVAAADHTLVPGTSAAPLPPPPCCLPRYRIGSHGPE
jgi:hypothetical protein